jgi:hypothetical protein
MLHISSVPRPSHALPNVRAAATLSCPKQDLPYIKPRHLSGPFKLLLPAGVSCQTRIEDATQKLRYAAEMIRPAIVETNPRSLYLVLVGQDAYREV